VKKRSRQDLLEARNKVQLRIGKADTAVESLQKKFVVRAQTETEQADNLDPSTNLRVAAADATQRQKELAKATEKILSKVQKLPSLLARSDKAPTKIDLASAVFVTYRDGTSRTIYMENEEPDRVLEWLFDATASAPFSPKRTPSSS